MKKKSLVICLMLLISNLSFGQPLELPYFQSEVCEGAQQDGHCHLFRGTGQFKLSKPLNVYSKPLESKVIATIPSNTFFEVLTWRLYTLATVECVTDEEGGKIKKGGKYYPLSFAGDAQYFVWHDGKTSFRGGWNSSDVCGDKSRFQTQYWSKINYKGDFYWWPTPKTCEAFGCVSGCSYRECSPQ